MYGKHFKEAPKKDIVEPKLNRVLFKLTVSKSNNSNNYHFVHFESQ